MATLLESLELVKKLRPDNPGLDSLNDQELADLVFGQTNDDRFAPAAQSSSLGRGVAKVGKFFSELGQSTEEAIASKDSPFAQRVAGRAANQLVSSAPELAMNVGAGALKGLPRLAGYGASAAFSFGRTKAETGDTGAALGSAAGTLASLYGGIKGASVGRKLAGEKGAKGFIGGTLGSAAGSTPGDVLEIATAPGGVSAFLEDDVNLPAYLVGNVGVGAAMDLAVAGAESRTQKAQKVKAETPEFDTLLQQSIADELVRLQKKPVAELTELDKEKMLRHRRTLAELEEKTILSKTNKASTATVQDIQNMPEVPATIRAQKYLLHKGKKSVIEIPKGTELPVSSPHSYEQLNAQYVSPLNGNTYEYDDKKVTPEIIDSAIKSNTLGTLLGYGTAGVPANPTGQIAVLRGKRGHEKAAVILGDGNENSVMAALKDMALGEDTVSIETPAQVAAWRARNSGLLKLHSLSKDIIDPLTEGPFINRVFENFAKAFGESGNKGARFQLDQNGMISGNGLLKAVKQWAPKDIWEVYLQAGIETLLSNNKVAPGDFTKWLRENTPEVEVKKLVPFSEEQDKAYVRQGLDQHSLEGANLAPREENGRILFGPEHLTSDQIVQPYFQQLARRFEQAYFALGRGEISTDAATGRYGVEPKELSEMPGAVDILVRVPTKPDFGIGENGENVKVPGLVDRESVLFRGPHFGNSDVNVLASIRGYMETLPSGEKVFHIFEVQSDWGQRYAKENGPKFYGYQSTPNHPLLSAYETLALKTAIQHARAEGARYIAISDAETAMMTEGHDKYARDGYEEALSDFTIYQTREETIKQAHRYAEGRGKEIMERAGNNFKLEINADKDIPGAYYFSWVNQEKPKIKQEPGMRAAYDDRLPTIARKLTGDRGQVVDFGVHKAVETGERISADATVLEEGVMTRPREKYLIGSPVFKNADSTPKTDITARLYDITNPSTEVSRLFSLYDLDAQNEFDATLAKEVAESANRNPDELTPRGMLERAARGDRRVNVDALVNFVNAIKGTRGVLREGTILQPGVAATMDVRTRDIKFNRNLGFTVDQAFSKLSHELTHGAILDLESIDPAAYNQLISLVDELGVDGRRALFQELKDTYKLGNMFDVDYLAGNSFDANDQLAKVKQMHEFVAGIMEVTAQAHLKNQTPHFLTFLPEPVSRLIANVVRTIKSYFRKEFPNLSSLLNPIQTHRLNSIVDIMQKQVIDVQQANIRAVLNLKKTDVFDVASLRENLPEFRENLAASLKNIRGGELHSFASDLYKNTVGKAASVYENLLFSAMFRTRTKPWTAGHFWNLHSLRPNIQADNFGFMAFLGQDANNALSRQEALERWAGFFDRTVSNPSSKEGAKFRQVLGDVIEENTNRREKLSGEGKPISWDDMVKKDELVSKHGLTSEQAEFAYRIIRLPEMVIQETHRKNELLDAHRVAKMFFRANKQQDLNGVVQKVMRLNRIANDFGDKRYELDVYSKRLAFEKAQAAPNQDLILYLSENVDRLKSEHEAFRILLDQAMRQEFAGAIPMKDGPDGFLNQASELMVRLAAIRWVNKYMTQDAGYAPMTRRGRFMLRVFSPEIIEGVPRTVKEFKGFDDEKKLRQYMQEQGLTDKDVEIIDKNELQQRAAVYSPDRMKELADRNKQQLRELIQDLTGRTADLDPVQRENVIGILNELEQNFGRSLREEIADVIAIKGDKFKERRWLVPGFDKEDFLPNIFEYMDYKTVSSNKQLTKAIGDLELERPELDADQELKQRMTKELNYTLSNQSEFNALRKATFYYYLGASVRHVIQNAVQIPLNGVSQMVAGGTGVVSSYKHFSKAAALATKYNFKGTTGDKELDIFLKQAEKEGVSFQAALEAPVHESIELQNAIDSLNALQEGKSQYGAKLRYQGTAAWKALEKFLMSTSSAAESANRKTTFIAGVLAERAKGVKNPVELYQKASEFTNYVNFVGDKPNRPGYLVETGGTWAHGPLMLVSALQSFTINHISQLYAFGKLAKGGSKADQKALITGIAHLLAFSGTLGLVGASTAEQLFEEMTGVSLRTAIRQNLVEHLPFDDSTSDRIGDLVLQGLPALAGADLANSIGLGSPFFRYQAGQAMTVEQLGGAAVGLFGRVKQAVGEVTADPFNPQQWWQATRTAAPAFLANAVRAADVINAGTVLDSKQQPTSDPLGISGSVASMLGFTPQEVSKQRMFNNEVYKSTKKLAEEYQRATLNIAQKLSEFRQTGNPDALVDANEQFSNYLASVNGTQDRNAIMQSITEQLGEFEGRVTKPATVKESASRQRIESAFPSVKPRYSSEFSSLLREIEVMLSLGQADLLSKKLQSFPSSAPDAVLTDLLVQAGLRPEDVGLLLQPERVGRLGR